MGQIVQNINNQVRCNLAAIQTGGSQASTVLAAGEIWLVDTTNASKGTGGYGSYDSYIIGDGTTAASALEVKQITPTDEVPTAGSKKLVTSGAVYNVALQSKKLTYRLYGSESSVIDLDNIEEKAGYICNGHFRAITGTNYRYKLVEVEQGKNIEITGNNVYTSYYCFLKSYETPVHNDETAPDYCVGTTMYSIAPQEVVEVVIPDDCIYMYTTVLLSGSNTKVASIEYAGEDGDINTIEGNVTDMQGSVSELENTVNTMGTDVQDTKESLFTGEYPYNTISDSESLVTGKYWKSTSNIISLEDSSSYLGCNAIECKKGDEFKITSYNSYTYIADENYNVIKKITNPQSTEELTVVINNDNAKYLCSNIYISYKSRFKVKKKYRETYIDVLNAELNDEVLQNEYAFEIIADVDSMSDNTYYYQNEDGKAVLKEGTGNYRGAEVRCTKEEVFEIHTYNSKTFVTTEDGTILRTINNPSSATIPLSVEITEDNAYYIRTNCYTSAAPYFSIQRRYIQSRIDRIEEEVKQLTLNNLKNKSALLLGASFAFLENGWFEIGCNKLGIAFVNKAVAGTSIKDCAANFLNNSVGSTTLSDAVANNDILVIMHVHNINVNNLPETYTNYTVADYEADNVFIESMSGSDTSSAVYSEAYDYVIKKWISLCYAERNNINSPWHNTQHGKPAVIVACTNWHDARQVFNTAIEELAKKWGLHLCDFARNVGFSCQEHSPATGEQPSILFARDTQSLSFNMKGQSVTETVGWHPLRGRNQYIQQRLGMIFYETLKSCTW